MRIALFLALALSACSGASSEAPATESPTAETTATETPATETPTTETPVCGTRGAAACPTGTFCDFAAGSNCGADDRGGHCAPIPEMCTREFMPVCGCDGQTHPTACTAHSAGVSVAHDGPC